MVRALLSGVANIVLIHNHPSGEPETSYHDTLITKKIRELAELHDIEFSNNIIVGGDKLFSYRLSEERQCKK